MVLYDVAVSIICRYTYALIVNNKLLLVYISFAHILVHTTTNTQNPIFLIYCTTMEPSIFEVVINL
jgi:hypothetical protein